MRNNKKIKKGGKNLTNVADITVRGKYSVEDGILKTIRSKLPKIIKDVLGGYRIGETEIRFEDSNGLDIQNNDLKFIISLGHSPQIRTARNKLAKQIAEEIRKIISENISISVYMKISFSAREEL